MAISGASVVTDAFGRQQPIPVSEIRADGTASTSVTGQRDLRSAAVAQSSVQQTAVATESQGEILAAQRAALLTQPAVPTAAQPVTIRELLSELDTLGQTLDSDRRSREAKIANEPNRHVFERVVLNPGVVVDAQPTLAGPPAEGPKPVFTGEPTALLSEHSRGKLGMGLPESKQRG